MTALRLASTRAKSKQQRGAVLLRYPLQNPRICTYRWLAVPDRRHLVIRMAHPLAVASWGPISKPVKTCLRLVGGPESAQRPADTLLPNSPAAKRRKVAGRNVALLGGSASKPSGTVDMLRSTRAAVNALQVARRLPVVEPAIANKTPRTIAGAWMRFWLNDSVTRRAGAWLTAPIARGTPGSPAQGCLARARPR